MLDSKKCLIGKSSNSREKNKKEKNENNINTFTNNINKMKFPHLRVFDLIQFEMKNIFCVKNLINIQYISLIINIAKMQYAL